MWFPRLSLLDFMFLHHGDTINIHIFIFFTTVFPIIYFAAPWCSLFYIFNFRFAFFLTFFQIFSEIIVLLNFYLFNHFSQFFPGYQILLWWVSLLICPLFYIWSLFFPFSYHSFKHFSHKSLNFIFQHHIIFFYVLF